MKESQNRSIIEEDYSDYKKGISIQREIYKNANLNRDYDTMIKCIENIKIEISSKAKKKGCETTLNYIEKCIEWYHGLPSKYKKKTENGIIYNYPDNLYSKVNIELNKSYEKIIKILEILDLI